MFSELWTIFLNDLKADNKLESSQPFPAVIFFSIYTEMLICYFFISFFTSFLSSPDFNYNTDGYEGEGAEDGKSQDGSETLPYIDESPTMSPQLCAPQGPDGEAVSPTPPEGLPPGVRAAHTRRRTGRH